jgi:DNA repair exonuclease SbcCD nuclease subunit
MAFFTARNTMSNLFFVATADLHFDEQGSWKYRGITGDAEFALAQVVDYCLDHGPEALWLLGDIVNRPMPRQSAIKEIYGQFDRLQAGGIPTRYILGDHDGRQDWPDLHPWPRHMDGLCATIGPFQAYGLDYLPKGKLQAALRDAPPWADILMTHQKWAEFVHASAQGKLADVPDHFRYIITGDYHDQVCAEIETGQQVWSPGSTIATSVADHTPRLFIVGRQSGDTLHCEFHPLRSRPIHRVRIETDEELAVTVTEWIKLVLGMADRLQLPDQLRRPIVDVEYYTDIPSAYERLRTIADRCHLFLRPRDRARQARQSEARRARAALSVEEAVGRLARPGTPGHDWTLRLLAAQDKRAEWRAIVAEQGEDHAG